MAQANTTAKMACPPPNCATKPWAIALAEPLSSISRPKIAPSRNKGKNEMMKLPAEPMNTWV